MCLIKAHYSPRNFGYRYATSLTSNKGYQVPSIFKWLDQIIISTIKAYLQAFINFEQNDQARILLIIKFAYNNAKNASTSHTPFEFNYGYHFWVLYKKKVDSYSKSKSVDKRLAELRELMVVCQENLHYAQELQKQAYTRGVKPQNYASANKIWLNSKYIKTKHNQNLEAKFFRPFQLLHPVGKQAYKLELSRK